MCFSGRGLWMMFSWLTFAHLCTWSSFNFVAKHYKMMKRHTIVTHNLFLSLSAKKPIVQLCAIQNIILIINDTIIVCLNFGTANIEHLSPVRMWIGSLCWVRWWDLIISASSANSLNSMTLRTFTHVNNHYMPYPWPKQKKTHQIWGRIHNHFRLNPTFPKGSCHRLWKRV